MNLLFQPRCALLCASLFFSSGLVRVGAQPVMNVGAPPPAVAVPATAVPPPEVNPSLAAPPLLPTTAAPFQWGTINLRPRVSFEFLHGDDISVSPGRQLTTSVYNFTAGATLEIGPHWAVDYAGTRSIYSNEAFHDAFNQFVSLAANTTYQAWTFRIFHAYEATDVPLVETASQTKQRMHTSEFGSSYALGNSFLLELNIGQHIRFADAAPTAREWPFDSWVSYRVTPGLLIGAGFGAGYAQITPGADMIYSRPQLRFKWEPRETLTFQLTGGQEFRTFYTHPRSHFDRTVYNAMAEYRPFRTTIVAFYRERVIAASYFSNQVSENTKQAVQLQQRIFGHFYLSTEFAQQWVRYLDVDLLSQPGELARDDRRRSLNVKLSTVFLKRGTTSISYQRNRNLSSLEGYGFTSNQFAFEIGFRF